MSLETPQPSDLATTAGLVTHSALGDEVRGGGLAPLAWIVVAGAIVRVVLWVWFGNQPIQIFDEKDYDRIAANLVQHGEFAFSPGQPTSSRPPLYPAAVAGVYRLFGVGNYRAVRLLQSALSLVTLLVLYRLGTEVHSRRLGLWLAGLYGFYPSLLVYNNLLLTEVLFTALLCTFCYMLIRSLRTRSFAGLAVAGVVLGLGALTRSILWPFVFPLGVLLVFAWQGRVWERLLAVVVLCVGFGATTAPWLVRNYRVERTFQPVDSIGGRNFMMGNYEYTLLYRMWDTVALKGERSWFGVLMKEQPSIVRTTQGQRDKIAMRYGLRFALQHPGLTLKRDVIKFFDFWGLEREVVAGAAHGYFGPVSKPALVVLTLLIFGSYAAALFSGIFGMILEPLADLRVHCLFLLIIAFHCAVHTATYGHSRYHLPIMPLVLVYSATALINVRALVTRWRAPSFWLAGGLCSLFLLNWAWGMVHEDGELFRKILHTLG